MPAWTAKHLTEVIAGCQDEERTFRYRGLGPVSEEGACYELFRRAIVDGCQSAWDAVYAQYSTLVAHWLIGSSNQDLVQESWLKFATALPTKRFSRTRHVGDVLALLRRCARSVSIDAWRKAERERQAQKEWLQLQDEPIETIEDALLDRAFGVELWDYVRSRLLDEQERLIVALSFVDGLPPREILARCPQHFPDVQTVYRVKERVVDRLSRDPKLLLWRSQIDAD